MSSAVRDGVVVVTVRELDALHELPHMAQVLYLRGLRPFLDINTGLVGVRRRISERGLAEIATVPARPGRSARYVVEPTRDHVRQALSALESAGLIRPVRGVDRCFVFYLPAAVQGKSVRRSSPPIRPQDVGAQKPHNGAGFEHSGDASSTPSSPPHQGYISTTTTEASVKGMDARASNIDVAVVLPAGTDLELWEAFCGHAQTRRQWSIYKARVWAKHLRDIADDGGDPSAVLDWAIVRGLTDLRDAHKRMRRDAAREAMADKREGESLANRGARQVRERYGPDLRVIQGGALLGNGDGDGDA